MSHSSGTAESDAVDAREAENEPMACTLEICAGERAAGLFWISTDRTAHPYGQVEARSCTVQSTWSGHVWEARVDVDGAELALQYAVTRHDSLMVDLEADIASALSARGRATARTSEQ